MFSALQCIWVTVLGASLTPLLTRSDRALHSSLITRRLFRPSRSGRPRVRDFWSLATCDVFCVALRGWRRARFLSTQWTHCLAGDTIISRAQVCVLSSAQSRLTLCPLLFSTCRSGWLRTISTRSTARPAPGRTVCPTAWTPCSEDVWMVFLGRFLGVQTVFRELSGLYRASGSFNGIAYM